jgi:hypothetical protein
MDIKIEQEQIEKIIYEIITLFLIPKFRELGMHASGEWESNIEARGNQIWGRAYTEQLVNGREPGSMPPVEAIQRWALAKFGNGDINVAWAIATKIKNEGTSWYPNGSDLLEVLESKEVVDFISDKLKDIVILQITTQFKREFA